MVIELEVKDNILNCPCCNSRPKRFKGMENNKYWIECNNSNCSVQPETRMYKIKGLDIIAWNKRKITG